MHKKRGSKDGRAISHWHKIRSFKIPQDTVWWKKATATPALKSGNDIRQVLQIKVWWISQTKSNLKHEKTGNSMERIFWRMSRKQLKWLKNWMYVTEET